MTLQAVAEFWVDDQPGRIYSAAWTYLVWIRASRLRAIYDKAASLKRETRDVATAAVNEHTLRKSTVIH